MLLGRDTIRTEQTQHDIYKTASELQESSDYASTEKIYRNALLIYPNDAGMILELAGVLALSDKTKEAIELMERGLSLSENEKQKATIRAALCFLYLNFGRKD